MKSKNKTVKKKCLAALLSAALMLGVMPACLAFAADDVSAATYSFSAQNTITSCNGKRASNTQFSVPGLDAKGLCCHADLDHAGSGKVAVEKLSNNGTTAKLAYYYGYKKGWLDSATSNRIKLARALSLTWYPNGSVWPFAKSDIQPLIDAVRNVNVPDNFVCYHCMPTDKSQDFIVWKWTEGHIKLTKKSSTPQFEESFYGCVYGVYTSKSGKVKYRINVKKDGTANILDVPEGQYYIKEIETNNYYGLSSEWHSVTVKDKKTASITVSDSAKHGWGKIRKISDTPGFSESFYGCEYSVFRTKSKTGSPLAVFKVKSDGTTDAQRFPVGTYYVTETATNSNYFLNSTWYTLSVEYNTTKTVTVKDSTSSEVTIKKTLSADSDDGGTVEGFTFKLTNAKSGKVYTEKTDKGGNLDFKELVPGTYKVQEILSEMQIADGYSTVTANPQTIKLEPKKTYALKWTNRHAGSKGLKIVKTTEDGSSAGGFQFRIDAAIPGKSLSEKTFRIKAGLDEQTDAEINADDLAAVDRAAEEGKTGSYPVRVTVGEDAVILTVNVELKETGAEEPEPKGMTVEENGKTYAYNDFAFCGAAHSWSECSDATVTDSGGMVSVNDILPGEYTVTEILTDDQKKHYETPQPQTKTVTEDSGSTDFVFACENKVKWSDVSLKKTCTDPEMSVEGIQFTVTGKRLYDGAEIEPVTAATDENGNINFGRLYAGSYVIEETGFDAALYAFPADCHIEGHAVPAKQITVTGREDSVTVEFENVPLVSLPVTKVDRETGEFLSGAVFDLYEGDKKICTFEITGENETEAAAVIIWKDEGTQVFAGEEAGCAQLKGLAAGQKYRIKETKPPEGYAPLYDETFVMEKGRTVVAENGKPEIMTEAKDKASGSVMANAGQITIVDTVIYRELEPGHRYIVQGTLMDQGSGEPVQSGGKAVTASREFTPSEKDGKVKVEFSFDASALAGRTVVAFEKLTDPLLAADADVIAVHEDIEDEKQTVYIPDVATSAVADSTGKHIAAADGEAVITDTVGYRNLLAGTEYKVEGILMDKETGQPVISDGDTVTAEAVFTPEGEGVVSGSVELVFTFNAEGLAGKSLVAFEKLTLRGVLIGSHEDMEDEEQTVHIPAIETQASAGKRVFEDRVAYRNLLPGESYVMKGILMDKATAKAIRIDDRAIIASQQFVPDEADGEILIRFDADADKLAGKTAVAFETCYITDPQTGEETEIISHKDINNQAQTVSYRIPTDTPETGQKTMWVAVTAQMLMLLAAMYVVHLRLKITK